MFLFVASIVIALSVSFMCSLLEACVLSLSMSDVARLSAERPHAGNIWKRFKENIQRPIAAILIVNTVANTMGAAVSSTAFDDLFGQKWIFLYSIVFSLVVIQWCEILPKTIGVRFNRRLAGHVAVPLAFFVRLCSPVVWLIQAINSPFTGRKTRHDVDAINEIVTLTRFAAMNKLLSPEQAGIISRSVDLSRTTVGDAMVNRAEICHLSTHMKMHEAFLEAHVHRHTRFLLVEENNIDRVVGYVNFKDIVGALKVNPKNPTLQGIVRPIISIPTDASLISLLNTLTKNHQHIALVRGPDGVTAGMITLEDVMEAIVGDIQDEYDVLPNYLNKLSATSYLAGGGVKLSALHATVSADFPDLDRTLGEWLRLQTPKGLPKVDTVVRYQKWNLAIRRIRRSAIFEVTIDKT